MYQYSTLNLGALYTVMLVLHCTMMQVIGMSKVNM